MSKKWTPAQMEERLVRYDELRPCLNAFVDTYTPGSDKKENFTIIGPGVAEHPDQHVHIREPHGFNIGGARQPPGCINSQHSHISEEVFVVHSGQWAFRCGVDGGDAEVILNPGDCISLPVNVFRGFQNVGEEEGYLFAVLGRDDPGKVTWAPEVFEEASQYGLVLLENGQLVDTTKGETVPAGISAQASTTAEEIAAHRVLDKSALDECVVRAPQQKASSGSLLSDGCKGATESPLIGMASAAESIAEGPLAWAHGFHLRRLDMAPGSRLPMHSRQEQEVIFVHKGCLTLHWQEHTLSLYSGDVITVPVGLVRAYINAGDVELVAFLVRGGDTPAAPHWVNA